MFCPLILAVTLASDLSKSSGTVKATAMGGMYEVYDGDFAPCGCMTSVDGSSACPHKGVYDFTYDYKLPDKGSAWYANMMAYFNASIKIKAVFDFEDSASTTCKLSIMASKISGSKNSSAAQFVGAAILLVGVAAIGLKKRRVATIQLQEEEGTQSHFEMMPKDSSVQV
jgi:hypothetical protein